MNIKNIILFITAFLIMFLGCRKDNIGFENGIIDNDNQESISEKVRQKTYDLPVSYKKLELFLDKNFIPVSHLKTYFNIDGNAEFFLAYKRENNKKIEFVVFELLPSEILKKKFELVTDIVTENNFSMQFEKIYNYNDIAIMFEGKTSDNKSKMYIVRYNYSDDKYSIVGSFIGDFSIVLDYDQIEAEEGNNFSKIKNIVVYNNSLNTTNPNVQVKNTFVWNNSLKQFLLDKTEEISLSISNLNKDLYFSEGKYLEYIKGVWFPIQYKEVIDNNKLKSKDFGNRDIRFIFFSNNPNEVSIKYGDYMDKYYIVKVSKLWSTKPSLRLSLKEFISTDVIDQNIPLYIDITLLDTITLHVDGPNRFDTETYVRLQNPINEYIQDRKIKEEKDLFDSFAKKISGEFLSKNELVCIKFNNQKEFSVSKNKISESGNYKLTINNDQDFIISFLYDSPHTIIQSNNFIIKLDVTGNNIMLVPITFDFTKTEVDEMKMSVFNRKKDGS